MTLRRRILGIIALVLLGCIAAGGVLTYWHAVKKVRVEMESAIAVGANSAREAVAPLTKNPEPARQLQRIVASFNGDRHLKAVWVGLGGATLAESELLPPADYVPGWFYSTFLGQAYTAVVPLPAKMTDLGELRLASDAHNEVAEVWEDLALKTAIVVAFAALVLWLVHTALARALRPLEKLSNGLARVGAGDYGAQVPIDGPLELSGIYREFNQMALQLRDSEIRNSRLNNQLQSVQEDERAEIARDLHDEFGPFLFSIDVDARSLTKRQGGSADHEVDKGADAIRHSVAHMQKHLKSILGRLRPTALLDLGLSHAIDHTVDFWHCRHPDIAFDVRIEQTSFGSRTDDICFRVVQEALSNAVRHGKPSHIAIEIRRVTSSRLRITISDDGGGLKTDGVKGFGLIGMRERLTAVSGVLSVSNRTDEKGVIIEAELPISETAQPSRRSMSSAGQIAESTPTHENIAC